MFYEWMVSTFQEIPKDKPYESSDYTTVYNLVSHSSKRSTEDFLQRTVMAVFLLRCLQDTDYFDKESKHFNSVEINSEALKLFTVSYPRLITLNFHLGYA